MITQISIVSGEILTLLEETRVPIGVQEIASHLDEPQQMIHMSLGWLIRQGLVQIVADHGEQVLVSRVKDSAVPLSH